MRCIPILMTVMTCPLTLLSNFNITCVWTDNISNCYIAEFFAPAAHTLIGYFEVTWHLTIKLFPSKSLWAGNSAKSMTSEGNSALLPANVDQRLPLLLPLHVFLFVLYNKSLNDWSLGKQNQLFPLGRGFNRSRLPAVYRRLLCLSRRLVCLDFH